MPWMPVSGRTVMPKPTQNGAITTITRGTPTGNRSSRTGNILGSSRRPSGVPVGRPPCAYVGCSQGRMSIEWLPNSSAPGCPNASPNLTSTFPSSRLTVATIRCNEGWSWMQNASRCVCWYVCVQGGVSPPIPRPLRLTGDRAATEPSSYVTTPPPGQPPSLNGLPMIHSMARCGCVPGVASMPFPKTMPNGAHAKHGRSFGGR